MPRMSRQKTFRIRSTLRQQAQNNRRNLTPAELRLWFYLRNRYLAGYKFVREYVIGNFIVDFVCRQEKLIVEIEGESHLEAKDILKDTQRTQQLKAAGCRVIRFWNTDVYNNPSGVLEEILRHLNNG